MIEFGEKVKKLREEKGMTQQTMADQLYVTRAAVSRWECGARYPDLLTAKKIAEVLGTSIDELLSGEEFKRDIEKEPILLRQGDHYIQTILYTMGAISYLFIGICLIYSAFSYRISLYDIFTVFGYGISFMAMAAGIYFSVKNEISPRKTGVILSTEFLRVWFVFIGVCTMTIFVGNGQVTLATWFSLACNIVGAVLIIRFFFGSFMHEKRRISPIPIYVVGTLMVIQEVSHFRLMFTDMSIRISNAGKGEDLGFLLTLLVSALGQLAIGILTIYQAYVLDKKRRGRTMLTQSESTCKTEM